MPERHARMLRAAVVSLVVLLLSAGAHLGGGGILPHPGVLLGLGALTMLSVTVLAKRRLRLPALLTVLGGGQFALHHAFGLLSSTATTMVCHPDATHSGHSAALSCALGSTEIQSHAHAGGINIAMFAAHAIATLATAMLIARGEEALGAVARWLRPLFTVLQPSPIDPPARITPVLTVPRLHAVAFLISPPLRGPPAFR